ncbi:MAG: hypothetical protein HOB32_05165 [Nitrospina sp.]|nr:hypothetical protein [Nitrospina sp.]
MVKILKILLAQILTLVIFLIIIAVAGQIYTFSNPSYENLDVIPDRQIGWRLVPDSLFTYTGTHWYKREFKTQIKTNSLGFRDKERTIEKQKNLTRLVVIGDSFVVAREVPFDKTPSQLLERYLNEGKPESSSKNSTYEVLNFGVTGFSIPQSLLTNRVYVKGFSPRYVFLFIFEDTFWRAISFSHAITSTMNQNKQLHIRPTFNLQGNQFLSLLKILNFRKFHQFLVLKQLEKSESNSFTLPLEKEYVELIEQQRSLITKDKITKISKKLQEIAWEISGPNDFGKFVSLQNQVINSKFNGQRTKQREQKPFILDLWQKLSSSFQILRRTFKPELKMKDEMEKLLSVFAPKRPRDLFDGSNNFPNFEKTVFVNLKAIEVMRNDIDSYGGNLVIVDSIPNRIQKGRLPANLSSTILEYYCSVNNIGYIPLYKDLNLANSSGKKTSWSFDGHFNELGTKIFAEAMYRWLQNNGTDRALSN